MNSRASKKGNGKGLSVAQARKVAGVHYETVARWLRSGELHAKKVRTKGKSKQWRIERADLRRFLSKVEGKTK